MSQSDGVTQPSCNCCGRETVETIHAGIYVCKACERGVTLEVSSHVADKRWPERSDGPDSDILVAWKNGVKMDDTARNEHRLFGDEIRYHHGTTMILIRKKETLTTVVDFRTARSGIQGSVIKALVENDAETRVITEAVRIAGLNQEQFRSLLRTVGADSFSTPAGGGKTVTDLRRKS